MKASYLEVGQMEYGEALIAHYRFALLEQKKLQAMRESRPT